jgi:hypothetical protein
MLSCTLAKSFAVISLLVHELRGRVRRASGVAGDAGRRPAACAGLPGAWLPGAAGPLPPRCRAGFRCRRCGGRGTGRALATRRARPAAPISCHRPRCPGAGPALASAAADGPGALGPRQERGVGRQARAGPPAGAGPAIPAAARADGGPSGARGAAPAPGRPGRDVGSAAGAAAGRDSPLAWDVEVHGLARVVDHFCDLAGVQRGRRQGKEGRGRRAGATLTGGV